MNLDETCRRDCYWSAFLILNCGRLCLSRLRIPLPLFGISWNELTGSYLQKKSG